MRILVLALLLTGCAFAPELGTSEQEFRSKAVWYSAEDYRFVAAQGDTRVYQLNGVFYYFVNGALDRVDQGQLYQERLEVTIN